MKLFLGIDGGQSSTTALIGDETGRVLGIGRGGPCNHVKTGDGREKFTNAIQGCVGTAAQQAGLDRDALEFGVVCAGFSGGPSDKQQLLGTLVRTERLIVTHDALIALVGATGGEPGVIVIAGTGSIAFGRNGSGKTARAGGWGYIFGDEGGAFDITRQALRAALRMEEGWGGPTMLHALLMEATDAENADDLLHRFYTTDFPRPRIASLSQVVDQAARQGDAIATEILHHAAQQLASLTGAVRQQLFGLGETAHIAALGGVFRSEFVRERYRMLIELEEANRFAPPQYGPAAGALLEAYRAAGLSVVLSASPESEK